MVSITELICLIMRIVLLFGSPVTLGEEVEHIRTSSSEFVVDLATRSKFAVAAFSSRVDGVHDKNITSEVRVKILLSKRITLVNSIFFSIAKMELSYLCIIGIPRRPRLLGNSSPVRIDDMP